MLAKQLKRELISSVSGADFPAGEVLIGSNMVLVQGRYYGLSSALFGPTFRDNKIERVGELHTMPVGELIHWLEGDNLFRAAVGMAALNSMITLPETFTRQNAFEIIVHKSVHKNVGVIGHFPFVDKLSAVSKTCRVFERREHDGDLPARLIPQYLPDCDVVVITGQTVANGSIGQILQYAPKAFKVILGPSTPLHPLLFDYGIDVIAGARVKEPQTVLRMIGQGAHFKQLSGIELITLSREK